MSTDPPAWALRLVAAVETYENVHGQPSDGWYCLGGALAAVPDEVRQQSKGFEVAQRMFDPGSLVGSAADGHERTEDVKPERDGSAPVDLRPCSCDPGTHDPCCLVHGSVDG